jgi:hypothetical protein
MGKRTMVTRQRFGAQTIPLESGRLLNQGFDAVVPPVTKEKTDDQEGHQKLEQDSDHQPVKTELPLEPGQQPEPYHPAENDGGPQPDSHMSEVCVHKSVDPVEPVARLPVIDDRSSPACDR